MPFRRAGRPTWYAQVRTPTGWAQRSLGVPCTAAARPLAIRIEGMWETLASEHRAWDILGKVLADEVTITRVYDVWVETKYQIAEARRRLTDPDLDPLVEEFLAVHRRGVRVDSADHVEHHLRWLLPADTPCGASRATPEWLTTQLYRYAGKRNTLRKVHSSWSVFFEYLTRVRQLYPANPMDAVARPRVEKPPIDFYELETIEAIIAWQPDERRHALFSLLYGTPIEISTALAITRADINPATHEVRAPGTKAHTRDRVLRIDDWAWDAFWSYARTVLPMAKVFAGLDRWKVSDWHRQTVGEGVRHNPHQIPTRPGLRLERRIKLHASRHAWAIRFLRAGGPIAIAQKALGHSTAKETLDTYGAWIPDGADREEWGKVVAEAERKRREAQ